MSCKFSKIIPTSCYYEAKNLILIMMRTFIFLCCTTLFSIAPKHAFSQSEKIFIDADKELTVDEIFDIIDTQTDYLFIYQEDVFKGFPKVILKKGRITVGKLLNKSLSRSNLNIIFTENNKIIIKNAKGQQLTVTGKVTDQNSQPIPGATVLIKGTTKGTVTNIDGNYNITVLDPANVLVFSSLGFETKEITVGNQTTINISLKESISALDEVTINAGYYKTTERERTGSISKIDAKTIEKQPVTNPLAAMTGYLPGVNITQNTGVPGGSFNIEIRGKNFINSGTEPLYIVDGVPYNSTESFRDNNSASIHPNGNPGGLLNLINPSSIESIEVLKDADATAIYGSRGANGVVLITTKKGKAGKTKVVLKVSTGLASVPRFVDLLNTQQYLEMRKEAITNEGYTLETVLDDHPNFDDNAPDLYTWDQNRYTDWQDVLIGGTAYSNTANLSFSGGNQQTQFLLSGAYQNETTVLIGDSKYGQASVHGSINHQFADDRLQVNLTMDYTASDSQLPAYLQQLSRAAYVLPPNAPALYDANSNLNWENSTWENPLAGLEIKYRSQAKNLILNTILSYRPVTSLELKANVGYTNYNNDSYNAIPATTQDPAFVNTSERSLLFIGNALTQSWVVEPQINWKKRWGHTSLNMLVGATFSNKVSKQNGSEGRGFPSDDDILNLQKAIEITFWPSDKLEYSYQSIFGRLNFKWADRYIMNLTGRRDGSSRFGPGKQFGDFGALGLAWLFTEESFLKESTWLSFGKLRSSYGVTGSDNITDYAFFDTYTVVPGRDYNGSGLDPTRLFNPNFAWESNNKFEIALELGFLQDRIFLNTAWYRNRSSNQLIGIPLPGTTGFTTVNANFDATVENTGLEIDFRSVNFQNEHFKWSTTFNISVPKNKLVKFDGLEASTFKNDLVVGEPISISKRYHNIGVDPETGIYQFEDYNNDGVIDVSDRQKIEHTAPRFYGGIGNTINYKNWSLDAFFQFKKQRANSLLTGLQPGTYANQQVAVLDRWQQVGEQVPLQLYAIGLGSLGREANDAHEHYLNSDKFYTDASFIKLRNVSLSYALAPGSIPGMDVSIYLHGHNLLTFTKYKRSDPETLIGGWLPPLRQFTLGLQLGF